MIRDFLVVWRERDLLLSGLSNTIVLSLASTIADAVAELRAVDFAYSPIRESSLVARLRGTSLQDTAMDLVVKDGSRVQVVYFMMSEEKVRHELEGNICRCTGYHNIVKSIQAGASRM